MTAIQQALMAPGVTPTTLDPTNKGTGITISNGNLTAAATVLAGGNGNVVVNLGTFNFGATPFVYPASVPAGFNKGWW